MSNNIFSSLTLLFNQTLASSSLFLPRIFGALLALLLGAVFANILKRLFVRLLRALKFSNLINKTPLQLALGRDRVGEKVEDVLAGIFYWLVMLVVIHTTVTILGLSSLTMLLGKVLAYIPNIISAIFVLAFGILLAGWIESLVKGAIKSIDPRSSRLLGKFSSYLVVSIAFLTSLSELGIASEFITILFIGFISTISIGMGLALGLGGKEIVAKVLAKWYQKNFEVKTKASAKTGKKNSK